MLRACLVPFLSGALWASPYARQAVQQVELLGSLDAPVRLAAARALGHLRAREAAGALVERLTDESADVRRAVALALAWCGGRSSITSLLKALDDADWAVRQSAWVALTNLTGMELPFDGLAEAAVRQTQGEVWRKWWMSVPADAVPREVSAMLGGARNLALGTEATASTTYKGPASVVTDGRRGPRYFQTKLVPFPQWCMVDLGKPAEIGGVTVWQYGPRYSMTDYELSTSLDGKAFSAVHRKKIRPVEDLRFVFKPRVARYVRITSFASANPTYPTTFFEVQVHPKASRERVRAMRALGYLGGRGATQAVLAALEPFRADPKHLSPEEAQVLRAGMRSLGRLRDAAALPWLIGWLWETQWARYAADALGDLGDDRAVPALIAAFPRYSKNLRRQDPLEIPADDRTGLSHVDRMFETTFFIASALARLPFGDQRNVDALRALVPQFLANLPEDFDGAILYEREAHHLILAHLLDAAGLRQAVCEAAFTTLGQPRRCTAPPGTPTFPQSSHRQLATWLSAFCRDREDIPRLIALLDHRDGYVRINAAKTLAFLGDRRAVDALAARLATAKPEAAYGMSPRFLHEEFADPTPRYREAFARALGTLGAEQHVPLLRDIVADEQSAVEIRRAAAEALADIGKGEALTALRETAEDNPFLSVRQVARESLWKRRMPLPERPAPHPARGRLAPRTSRLTGNVRGASGLLSASRPARPPAARPRAGSKANAECGAPAAIVFIKGDNVLPHLFQTDPWRQSYITSDAGPVYRPGRNIYVLRPPRPDGEVTALTSFKDGFVAEIEVSWDGDRVIFCRRGERDPWWHLWEIGADGSALRQLTRGPFHDVGPAYLPDGRIVFASSRVGMRDEYHGYPATSLHVCDADGQVIRHIAVNTNRDNEPCILPTGHVLFSRLEVFYSRLKTELTLHAVQPDGRRDVVLYGPERRDFWYRQPRKRHPHDFFGWVHSMHRVLRITQAQGLPDGRFICATHAGLAFLGPDRQSEHLIPHEPNRAFTTPFPMPDGRVLCSSTLKTTNRKDIDVGICWLDPNTGHLEPIYNDPATADYEARPIMPLPRPPVLAQAHHDQAFTGSFLCTSVHETQEEGVREHGRLVRVIEGMPVVARHSTQTNPGAVWQNHHGTVARVLGTVPLASDGSFMVEVPADRLLQLQVLDSERQVLGNLLTWISTRPGEKRTCVGCHEPPNTTPVQRPQPLASRLPALKCLPTGRELRYRAKLWQKGRLRHEAEARLRTVRAVNLLAR